jgi:hypothetical protein
MSGNLTADEILELDAMSDVSLSVDSVIDDNDDGEPDCEYLFIFIMMLFLAITPYFM